MKRLIIIWTLFAFGIFEIQGQTVSGRVIDQDTQVPLPYATIGYPNTAWGTVANGDGYFQLEIPKNQKGKDLRISFLGYEAVTISSDQFSQQMLVELKLSTIELDELVIRPLSPEDYIKRAVRAIPKNYATNPFQTRAYYREKFTENGHFLVMTEAVFESHYPDYQDSIGNQHQLVLFRNADNIEEVAFMKDWREKREVKEAKKAAKKAAKKGEPVKKDTTENDVDGGIIRANFGGPEEVLSSGVVKGLDDCLDSTMFKKYKYTFSNGVVHNDRELLVIDFETKGKVDHMRQQGKIYIDIRSDAIVALDFQGKLVIPAIVQPILFAFGLGLKDLYFHKNLRYQEIDGIWYPQTIRWDFKGDFTKRYLFSSNEHSHFKGEQIFKVSDLILDATDPIPDEQRFDAKKDMEEQVYPKDGLSWNDINSLEVEEISKLQ